MNNSKRNLPSEDTFLPKDGIVEPVWFDEPLDMLDKESRSLIPTAELKQGGCKDDEKEKD